MKPGQVAHGQKGSFETGPKADGAAVPLGDRPCLIHALQ